MDDQVTAEALRKALHYSPETGVFTWLIAPSGRRVGDVAGSVDSVSGYARIKICGKRHMVHRLAWLYVHGEMPDAELDHRNGDRADNRIDNLRPATRLQQVHNAVWKNSHGMRGVHKVGEKYQARISMMDRRKGKSVQKSLGYYSTPAEANEVYELAAQMIQGEFYRGRA